MYLMYAAPHRHHKPLLNAAPQYWQKRSYNPPYRAICYYLKFGDGGGENG